MKLFLEFDPCTECKEMMHHLASPEIVFGDDKVRKDESAKFMRHLTYNHPEVVQAVMQELPKQKEKEEFDFFK